MKREVPFYVSLKVNSLPWLGGTTKLRMQQVRLEKRRNANAISKFETNSGEKSMAKSVETIIDETLEEWAPEFGIQHTQCCGLHSVTGFQYHRDGLSCSTHDVKTKAVPLPTLPMTLKTFVGAIQAAYRKQTEQNKRVAAKNEEAYRKWVAAGQRPGFQYPHTGYVALPQSVPGLLLFTWNSVAYEVGAKKLASMIKEAGLGECTISTYARNPNSGNNVAGMIWAVHGTAYRNYCKENNL